MRPLPIEGMEEGAFNCRPSSFAAAEKMDGRAVVLRGGGLRTGGGVARNPPTAARGLNPLVAKLLTARPMRLCTK